MSFVIPWVGVRMEFSQPTRNVNELLHFCEKKKKMGGKERTSESQLQKKILLSWSKQVVLSHHLRNQTRMNPEKNVRLCPKQMCTHFKCC